MTQEVATTSTCNDIKLLIQLILRDFWFDLLGSLTATQRFRKPLYS